MDIEKMTINDLKNYLVANTDYDFEINEWRGTSYICVKGLKKDDVIEIKFSNYNISVNYGKRFITFFACKKKKGSGFGSPCDSLKEVIKKIEDAQSFFGYELQKRKPKQISLF